MPHRRREMLTFRIAVSERGYEWVGGRTTGETTDEWLLVDSATEGFRDLGFQQLRLDDLTEHPVLFRKFASLSQTRESILKFANRYGPLGVRVRRRFVPALESDLDTDYQIFGGDVTGEPLDEWLNHIEHMRKAAELWDMIREKKHTKLMRHVIWIDEIDKGIDGDWDRKVWRAYYNPYAQEDSNPHGPHRQIITTIGADEPYMDKHFDTRNIINPAMSMLSRFLHEGMGGHVIVRPSWSPGENSIRYSLSVDDLLSALWTQFLQAVSQLEQHRQCPICGEWFAVTPAVARANRRYCSNACKQKAHRNNTSYAKSAFSAGHSIEEIASELDTNPDQILKWVNNPSRKRVQN